MARLFCIPGVTILFAAFVLNLIVSISLPYLPALDITRTHFAEPALKDGENAMQELRFGVWASCLYNRGDDRTCTGTGYAYSITVTDPEITKEVTISDPWTRGLAVHPVATAVSFLAAALALSEHITVALIATLIAWVASFLTFIAFLIDIALYAWTNLQFKRLDIAATTKTSTGFWLTFVAFILLFIGGVSTCLGSIKDRRAQRIANAVAAVEAAANTKAADVEKNDSETPPARSGWPSKLKFGKKSWALGGSIGFASD